MYVEVWCSDDTLTNPCLLISRSKYADDEDDKNELLDDE